MKKDIKSTDELIQMMQGAILQLQYLVNQNQEQQLDFLMLVETLLLEVISTAINLVEIHRPGSALIIYTDMEAAMKIGGIQQVSSASENDKSSSTSDIDINDMTNGMNYIGQQLAVTLFKSLHELPMSLRNDDMMLHGLEALLVNLLKQSFAQNAHQVLDRLCEHVHLALNDLTAREIH